MNQQKINDRKNKDVTVCKRLFLIIKRIILTFIFDISAELYLEVYIFGCLPKRIHALLDAEQGVFIPVEVKN